MIHRKKGPYQSVWGKRLNALPVRTLITIVVALNLSRHAGGVYVEDGLKRLARDMAGEQWGGSWWYPMVFRLPKPMVPVVPAAEWLS